jgi:hypothetical protein
MEMKPEHRIESTFKLYSVLKTSKKKDAYAYASVDDQGRQLVSDAHGHCIFRLNSPLTLPTLGNDLAYSSISKKLDLLTSREQFLLDAPDIVDLKIYMHMQKMEHEYEKGLKCKPFIGWGFGRDLPVVNARYLARLLTVFPDAKLYAAKQGPCNKAIYAASAYGDGVIMPVQCLG